MWLSHWQFSDCPPVCRRQERNNNALLSLDAVIGTLHLTRDEMSTKLATDVHSLSTASDSKSLSHACSSSIDVCRTLRSTKQTPPYNPDHEQPTHCPSSKRLSGQLREFGGKIATGRVYSRRPQRQGQDNRHQDRRRETYYHAEQPVYVPPLPDLGPSRTPTHLHQTSRKSNCSG